MAIKRISNTSSTTKETFMDRSTVFFSALALFGAVALAAPMVNAQVPQQAAGNAAVEASRISSGEVVKVDKDSAKITIKHGPLDNLNMPGMTMAFKVKDAAMLSQVKAGDKISFIAEKVNGALTVTKQELAK